MENFIFPTVYSTKLTKTGLTFDENKSDVHIRSNKNYLGNAGFAYYIWAYFILS